MICFKYGMTVVCSGRFKQLFRMLLYLYNIFIFHTTVFRTNDVWPKQPISVRQHGRAIDLEHNQQLDTMYQLVIERKKSAIIPIKFHRWANWAFRIIVLFGLAGLFIWLDRIYLAIFIPIPALVAAFFIFKLFVPASCPNCGGPAYLKRLSDDVYYYQCTKCGRTYNKKGTT